MVSEKNDKKRRGLRPLVAGIVAAATMLSPCVAYAGDGGAGSGPGSGPGSGIGTGKVSWVYKDSWGAPTRENAVAAMASIGVRNLGGAQSNQAIDQALNQANTECVNRSKSEGRGSAQCRLVGLGFVHTPGSAGDYYTGANGTFNADVWKAAYNSSGIPNNIYTYQGVGYRTSDHFNDGTTTINALASREMGKAPVAVIAIVLNQAEPPVNYDLGVSTKANGTDHQGRDTRNVADTIDHQPQRQPDQREPDRHQHPALDRRRRHHPQGQQAVHHRQPGEPERVLLLQGHGRLLEELAGRQVRVRRELRQAGQDERGRRHDRQGPVRDLDRERRTADPRPRPSTRA